MATKKATQKRARVVTVLVRYLVKQDAFVPALKACVKSGTVVLLVENDKGDRYYVTLRRSGQDACTCPHVPSFKSASCYHITHCRVVEHARHQASLSAADTAEINAILAVIDAKKPVRSSAQPVDIAERGQFHSARAFSLAL